MQTNQLMLADRRLPAWVALLTLAATWIGGGYLSGTAEAVYDPDYGLVWCQAPWCYAISLMVGGLFFAGPMRRRGYRTMLDLFAHRHSPQLAAVLFFPALVGDLFWTAAILVALGKTLLTMTGIDSTLAMALAMGVVVLYTVWGGLWSVAISDILQLVLIVAGLAVTLPFALEASGGIQVTWSAYASQRGPDARWWPSASAWSGTEPWAWRWLDSALLLIFGGIPWQVYFQRVLACRSPGQATGMSILAGLVCLVVAAAPVVIGMIGATADWPSEVGPPPDSAAVLPHVIQHLSPYWIGMAGLLALICAVMSSMDSSILSSASLFTWNMYRPLKDLSEDRAELRRVLRLSIFVMGLCALAVAISVDRVYQLWFLCADLIYVILFPQLTAALFFPKVTRVGAISGLVIAIALRVFLYGLAAGWTPLVSVAEQTEYWPRFTCAMIVSLATIAIVSACTCTSLRKTADDAV